MRCSLMLTVVEVVLRQGFDYELSGLLSDCTALVVINFKAWSGFKSMGPKMFLLRQHTAHTFALVSLMSIVLLIYIYQYYGQSNLVEPMEWHLK